MPDFQELFGIEPVQQTGRDVSIAALLALLAEILHPSGMEDEERGDREIPVRPRVEPLGGG